MSDRAQLGAVLLLLLAIAFAAVAPLDFDPAHWLRDFIKRGKDNETE